MDLPHLARHDARSARSGCQPQVKIALDTYHLGQQGDLPSRIGPIVRQIAIVQLGDARRPPNGEQNRCRLGDGVVPLTEIVGRPEKRRLRWLLRRRIARRRARGRRLRLAAATCERGVSAAGGVVGSRSGQWAVGSGEWIVDSRQCEARSRLWRENFQIPKSLNPQIPESPKSPNPQIPDPCPPPHAPSHPRPANPATRVPVHLRSQRWTVGRTSTK